MGPESIAKIMQENPRRTRFYLPMQEYYHKPARIPGHNDPKEICPIVKCRFGNSSSNDQIRLVDDADNKLDYFGDDDSLGLGSRILE